jgi:hypothetical protein
LGNAALSGHTPPVGIYDLDPVEGLQRPPEVVVQAEGIYNVIEQVPPDLGRRLFAAAHPAGALVAVTEHLEAHQLVDVAGRE